MGAILAGGLVLSACAPSTQTTGPATQPTEPSQPAQQVEVPVNAPLKLAVLVPLSASQQSAAQLGTALANAAELGVRDAGDPLVSVAVYDTGGDPGRARAVAQRAIQENADIILGPLLGSSTKAVAQPAAQAGLKVLSFSTDTSAAGDPVYLSGFIPEVAARRIVTFARSRGYGQVGVLYPRTAYGEQAITGAQRAGGGGIVVSSAYARTNDGIPPAAQAFAADANAAGADAVLLAESGQALQYLGALVRNYGLDPTTVRFLGLGEWNSRATLGETSLRGGWFAAPDPAAMKTFVDKYQAAYGSVPPPLAVLGYDAARIAAELAADARLQRTADAFTAEALTRARGFRGAVGPIRFEPSGIGVRGMAILEVGDGVFDTIAPVSSNVGS